MSSFHRNRRSARFSSGVSSSCAFGSSEPLSIEIFSSKSFVMAGIGVRVRPRSTLRSSWSMAAIAVVVRRERKFVWNVRWGAVSGRSVISLYQSSARRQDRTFVLAERLALSDIQ